MNRILIFCLILISQMAFSQDSNLINTWIMKEAFDCFGNKIDKTEETFWNITFNQNGVATIIVNQNIKNETLFKVNNQLIEFSFASYEILKITKDSLYLSDKKGRCMNYIFLSKEANYQTKAAILNKMNYKHFMYEGDTVFFANSINFPKMKGYINYHEYFIRSFPNLGKTSGCNIQFQFIVNKNGVIINPKGSISCLRDDSKTVDKIIKGMKGKWKPMLLDGKPVNALVREKFTHGKLTIINE